MTHSRGSTFAASSRRLNRRFSAYLDEMTARRTRRLDRLVAVFGGLAVTVGSLAAFSASRASDDSPWPTILTVVAIAAALGAALCGRRLIRFRREIRRLSGVVRSGVPVNGFLIQSNSALFKPQSEPLPCLVLISFQPEVASDIDYMRHLARRIYAMKNTRPTDRDSRYVAGLATNERAALYRRRPLPLSLTDGSTIYCADLWVRPSFLKDSCIKGDILPCIAEPGAEGGIELVPWWLLTATEAPLAQTASAAGTE